MKELFRAGVMLAVLVGLPAAWIYYGPLPPSGQKFVDRVVEVVKDATGWQQPYEQPVEAKTAPRFGAPETLTPGGMTGSVAATSPSPTVPIQVLPSETTRAQSPQAPVAVSLDQQLQPLLQRLRALGPEGYALEAWGSDGRFYRFRCEMPLGTQQGVAQQFEAIAESPAVCIQQVTAEVERWQMARATPPTNQRLAQHGYGIDSPQALVR